jgi:hypothetical protein
MALATGAPEPDQPKLGQLGDVGLDVADHVVLVRVADGHRSLAVGIDLAIQVLWDHAGEPERTRSGWPSSVARRVTKPIRNREAPVTEPKLE